MDSVSCQTRVVAVSYFVSELQYMKQKGGLSNTVSTSVW